MELFTCFVCGETFETETTDAEAYRDGVLFARQRGMPEPRPETGMARVCLECGKKVGEWWEKQRRG